MSGSDALSPELKLLAQLLTELTSVMRQMGTSLAKGSGGKQSESGATIRRRLTESNAPDLFAIEDEMANIRQDMEHAQTLTGYHRAAALADIGRRIDANKFSIDLAAADRTAANRISADMGLRASRFSESAPEIQLAALVQDLIKLLGETLTMLAAGNTPQATSPTEPFAAANGPHLTGTESRKRSEPFVFESKWARRLNQRDEEFRVRYS